MAGPIDAVAADLVSLMQTDISRAIASVMRVAVAQSVGTGSVTIRDASGERTIPKGMGISIRPGDVVLVARQGRTEVAVIAITVPGVAEPAVEGDWSSIIAALDGKVDKTDVIRKRLDTAVTTTSATYQGVSGLSLPVVAGETWMATWVLTSAITANGQVNLVAPSGTTFAGVVQGSGLWADGALVTGSIGYPLDGDGLISGGVVRIEVSILVTTTGTIQPQVKSANGTDQASIAAGSFLLAHRV